MATKKGVWNLQQVRDKQLQDLWSYSAEGMLFVWGINTDGQLGLNQPTGTAYSSPVQLPGTWRRVFATSQNSEGHFLSGDVGTLCSFGKNNTGQLGVNHVIYRSSPTQIPGTTWNKAGGGENVKFGGRTDGTLWTWGSNTYGSLGINNRTSHSSPSTGYGPYVGLPLNSICLEYSPLGSLNPFDGSAGPSGTPGNEPMITSCCFSGSRKKPTT